MTSTDFPDCPWALATVDSATGPLACLETGGKLYRLAPSLARVGWTGAVTGTALFDDWSAAEKSLTAAAERVDPADLVDPTLKRLAPVLYPGKVLCAGANYYNHMAEMGFPVKDKSTQRLFFFFKPPRNAVVGEGPTVHMPLDTQAFDWEVELAVVIGKPCRAVSVDEALDHVAGYTVAVDFCARDLNKAPEQFYKLDWVAGKAQETCCPLGPRFVPASAFADPQAIRLGLRVNGVTKQDDITGDMIFPIAEQLSILSRIMTLDPGDVVLTGTPAGVGAARQTFLSVGDRVEAWIDGIGTLTTTIQPPKTTAG
ncbi:MAG: fumarylacetoacetate hydrolase family protein [Rhodobacter sp.]|uniref:fumarylacetoacetate hydrolase family protein n=1 Tax=Pararhodobacter sp. TaxID=2127056 RepID=UPI001DA92464|nr:fumarylacetoacetate hydrolase family protein [Pararhodobacter sp.]MCB1344322.1 fumarylacetoacetate hydrolase family protein [Paracoccaceae bacterium]MCC0073351.1 fumarylacetoacetate hydrolase family protein [Rhodobacter sp.]HPD91189.1 fumarylacetoacetate hydrolase family protein [Pararhodobacter sp.]